MTNATLQAPACAAAADVLGAVLEPGQQIVVGQGYAAPRALIQALDAQRERLAGSRIFVGMLLDDFPELPETEIWTFFPAGPFGTEAQLRQHRVEYLRQSLYELADGMRTGAIQVDVALAQAAPARGGFHSLGAGVDYAAAAVERAQVTVLETGERVPWTGERSQVSVEPDRLVEVACGAMPASVRRPAGDRDHRLAEQIARWIPDGATIELGMGGWVQALAARLSGRRGLRIHTGLLGDWLIDLQQVGALDRGCDALGTAAGGSPGLYEWLSESPRARLAPAEITHDPRRLRALPRFRAVNSVLEVDLLGAANSEYGHDGRRGGVGGLYDFAHGAAGNEDGLSIIALPATAGGRSRIVPALSPVRASLAADAVEVVVTEHGSADLRGLETDARVRAMLAIAAPEHRGRLETAARELELL